MNKKIGSVRWSMVVIYCGMIVLAGSATGGLIIDEAFDAPVGGIPGDWVRVGTTADSQVIVENVGDDDRTMLRITRRDGLLYDPSAGVSQFSDLSGSVIVNTGSAISTGSAGGALGVGVRLNQVGWGGTTAPDGEGLPGYKFVIGRQTDEAEGHPFEGNPSHISIYSASVGTGHMHDLARTERLATTFVNIDSGADYEFRFSAIGSNLSASLWTIGAEPVQLATVSLSDAAWTDAGYFNLTVSGTSSSSRGFFSDLQVIPEPGTASLFMVALTVLGLVRRRMVVRG